MGSTEWVCVACGGLALLWALGALFSGPSKCDVCGLRIKRTLHTWTINGQKLRMCPKCNSRMENKKSREAFRATFGD